MRILGLDLSLTATGAVVISGDELAPETVKILRTETFKPKTAGVERLAHLVEAIRDMAAPLQVGHGFRNAVDMVAMEGYSYGSRGASLFQIGELGGCVKLALHRLSIPVVVIAPSAWRKQLLGKGNLPKNLVPLEMYKRYGIEQASVDALEAYAVALAVFRTGCGLDKPEPKARRRKAA